MPKEYLDNDNEPKKLVFGMSKEDLEQAKQKEKEKKKLPKNWRPNHD